MASSETPEPVVDNKIYEQLKPDIKRHLKHGMVKLTEKLVLDSHSKYADEIRSMGKNYYAECTERCKEEIVEIIKRHELLENIAKVDRLAHEQASFKDQQVKRLTGVASNDLPLIDAIVDAVLLRKEEKLIEDLTDEQNRLVDEITQIGN